jgi:hypothetical protein
MSVRRRALADMAGRLKAEGGPHERRDASSLPKTGICVDVQGVTRVQFRDLQHQAQR